MEPRPTLESLVVADDPATWRAAGFAVDAAGVCAVGTVRIRLVGRGPRRGIVGLALRDPRSLELDGLPVERSDERPAAAAPHANGAVAIDHVVAMSPRLERTVDALRDAGLDLRRLREGSTPGGSARQAFFRVGEAILEVVEAPARHPVARDPDGPARPWGIAFLAQDLEATVNALGDLAGTPRDAVQPGRRIVTLERAAGLGPAIAFMSP